MKTNEDQTIDHLVGIISKRTSMIKDKGFLNTMGSCKFRAAGVSNCLNLTEAECKLFDGTWSSNTKCSTTPTTGECKSGVQ